MLLYLIMFRKMKLFQRLKLLLLVTPLAILSACSYSGDVDITLNGDQLLSGSVIIGDNSFETIDSHIKAGDSFCLWISQDGCSACETFYDVFKEVNGELNILAFHFNITTQRPEVSKFFEAYPDMTTDYSPAFYVISGRTFTIIPYSKLSSTTKFKNALRDEITFSQRYYFESTNPDFNVALDKIGFTKATVIEVDLGNVSHSTQYKSCFESLEAPYFIHQINGLETFNTFAISK